VILVGIQGAISVLSIEDQTQILYDYALVPRRFFAPAGSPDAYPDMAAKLLTLVSTGFLHGGWLHVLVNTGMLLAFGTQVARLLGSGPRGVSLWLLLFLASVIAGSAAYLAIRGVDGGAAVGASGGISGLVGAAFLVGFDGQGRSLVSRSFLMMTAAFALGNGLLALAGPSIAGAGLAWQAHLGGYVAGALIMAVLARRPAPAPAP
jgi:membrane associated rhomboid family serine protease